VPCSMYCLFTTACCVFCVHGGNTVSVLMLQRCCVLCTVCVRLHAVYFAFPVATPSASGLVKQHSQRCCVPCSVYCLFTTASCVLCVPGGNTVSARAREASSQSFCVLCVYSAVLFALSNFYIFQRTGDYCAHSSFRFLGFLCFPAAISFFAFAWIAHFSRSGQGEPSTLGVASSALWREIGRAEQIRSHTKSKRELELITHTSTHTHRSA
jgi:hypothetical protein